MAVDSRHSRQQMSASDRIACLICERVNPACGWEQPLLVQEVAIFGRWSVCRDCVDRRTMGQD